tara:strand:+ start:2878 stop:4236 length:1359 start_codon:yes stop_codon:yes gene_type:complete
MKNHNIDFVSVLFVYKEKVFAVQRQPNLKEFPGYHAFPAGKTDINDSSTPFKTKFFCENKAVHMRALKREILEQLGYDIENGIKNGEVFSMSKLAEVVAPEFEEILFKTWFYRVDLNKKINFNLDSEEFTNSFWETPESLLDTFLKGNSLMIPTTRWILEKLKQMPSAKQLGDLSQNYENKETIPCLEILKGIKILAVKSDTLPPANVTNAFLLGDKYTPKLLIDPSPNSLKEFQRLLKTIEDTKIDFIFLTHHHPDHHQFSNLLARKLSVPIILSKDTQQRLEKKFGIDYFKKIKLHNPINNEEVTRWHGSSVRIFEIPGHDAGHLGLAPDCMKWFLVGDLIQGIGTVVIPSPEGDMATYFLTLKKIISLNPEILIPSHGFPSRSIHRLKETLTHRLKRESQILDLYNSGISKQGILEKIYLGIDPRLKKFAIQNIESHLTKLYKEKQLIR